MPVGLGYGHSLSRLPREAGSAQLGFNQRLIG